MAAYQGILTIWVLAAPFKTHQSPEYVLEFSCDFRSSKGYKFEIFVLKIQNLQWKTFEKLSRKIKGDFMPGPVEITKSISPTLMNRYPLLLTQYQGKR